MKDETACNKEHDAPSGTHSHTYTYMYILYKTHTHTHISTVHTNILISWGKQCKEWLHFEKKALVLITQSNARVRSTVFVWTFVRLFFHPESAPGHRRGSDHIHQAHSQFCSGISSISLSLRVSCSRTHTCRQPLTTRHASLMC